MTESTGWLGFFTALFVSVAANGLTTKVTSNEHIASGVGVVVFASLMFFLILALGIIGAIEKSQKKDKAKNAAQDPLKKGA